MYKKAWDKIISARHTVIVSHVHPDGDTIGSSLGLYSVLKKVGCRVSLFNETKEELPKEFDFLEGYSKIQNKLPKSFDLLVSCDCGSLDRLKIKKGDFEIINIDHHKSNELFGDINIVLPEASSAGMVVYKLLKENDIDIPKESAISLYTSIAEDTNFFRYGGVDEKTFEAAAELIRCGANAQEIAQKVKSRQSLAKIRLIAYMLSNFELHVDATIASIIFDKKILEETGAKRSDTKNIISMLRDIANVKVALMVLAQDEFCKISLRSDGDIDVSKISIMYNGGGHKGAAGFNVNSSDTKATCKEITDQIKAL
ncbi:DHH family phosphoesterase [Sulfurospirillum arcachonense]|uniref:DHH family phosphoesterase n=1 Tax=Sulfurospirillum arcachonense TaxID=57666 RepID=UPI000469F3DC|nr:bifunctional oligoribonuclease/PAP phosphatase NrnA [Sulfurospirillum arcachonense]